MDCGLDAFLCCRRWSSCGWYVNRRISSDKLRLELPFYYIFHVHHPILLQTYESLSKQQLSRTLLLSNGGSVKSLCVLLVRHSLLVYQYMLSNALQQPRWVLYALRKRARSIDLSVQSRIKLWQFLLELLVSRHLIITSLSHLCSVC